MPISKNPMAYQFLSYPHISPFFPFWISQKWVIKTMRHRQLRRPPRDRSPRRSQGLKSWGTFWMQLRQWIEENPFPPDILRYPPNESVVNSTGSRNMLGSHLLGEIDNRGMRFTTARLLAPLWLQEILEGLVESILFAMRWLKLLVLQFFQQLRRLRPLHKPAR